MDTPAESSNSFKRFLGPYTTNIPEGQDIESFLSKCPDYSLERPETYWDDWHFFFKVGQVSLYKTPSLSSFKASALAIIELFNGSREVYEGYAQDFKLVIFAMSIPQRTSELLFSKIFDEVNGDLLIQGNSFFFEPRELKKTTTHYIPPVYTDEGVVRENELADQFIEPSLRQEEDQAPLNLDATYQFWNDLYQKILAINDSSDITKKERDLMNVLGYICLNLFKLFTREPRAVWNSMKCRMDKSFRTIFGKSSIGRKLPPVHYNTLVSLKSGWDNSNKILTSIFHSVIVRYVVEETERSPNQKVSRIFQASCLFHCGLNGMTLVNLYEQVKRFISSSNELLIKILCSTNTIKSLLLLVRLYAHQGTEYILPGYGKISTSIQYSWRWAKIFDYRAFRRFSGKDNVLLCQRLASIISKFRPDSEVKKMYIFKPEIYMNNFIYEDKFAEAFFKKYGPRGDDEQRM